MGKKTLVFDVETYSNFFLVLFKDFSTGEVLRFQISPNRTLDVAGLHRVLKNNLLVGFNSKEYDAPMIQLALKGYTTQQIKEASDQIILGGVRSYEFSELHGLQRPDWDHIDLMPVCPLKGSLKIYAGRLHCKKMADLPYDPNLPVTAEQAAKLAEYCENDLANTHLIWTELAEQIKLREELSRTYEIDLRSKSDAQIAEAVIVSELSKVLLYRPKRPEGVKRTVRYNVPDNVQFTSKRLNCLLDEVRDAKFSLKENGSVILPDCLDTAIRLGAGVYRMGIGGLHSSEKSVFHVADDEFILTDRDVASFYPKIILNQKLYPSHLGPAFLDVYGKIVDRRLTAKRAKRKEEAESLKIVVNGGFGKFGSMWSVLYSPQLLIQVTISGQLYLLMLIEMIEAAGIEVISANTDGIVIKCPRTRYDDLNGIVSTWEKITDFETEETRYKAVYSRDVNNYIALKESGGSKGKGAYANHWEKDDHSIYRFHKNPTTTVCIEAVTALLDTGKPLNESICGCRDISKFVAVRTVAGGAKDPDGLYLGKAIRWYYAKERHGSLNYSKRRAKVNKSDGARPLMELPDEFPSDINYGWYEAECHSMLKDLGWLQRRLF